MSDHGCIHLSNFKAAKGIQPYRIIHAYFVACTTAEARSRKVCACVCFAFEFMHYIFIIDSRLVKDSETVIRLDFFCSCR